MNMTTINCANGVLEVGPELGVVADLAGDVITVFRKANMCCIKWGGSEDI
jgi:hypothetical protein